MKKTIAALLLLASSSAWADYYQKLEVYEGRWEDTGSVCRMTLRFLPGYDRNDPDFWRFADVFTNATDIRFGLFRPSRFLKNGWEADRGYPTRMLVVTFLNESSPIFAYGVTKAGENKIRVCKDMARVEGAPEAEEFTSVASSGTAVPVFSLAARRTNPFFMKNAEEEWFNFSNIILSAPDSMIVVRSAQTPSQIRIRDGFVTDIDIDFTDASRLTGEEKCAYLLSRRNVREKYDTLIPLPSSGKQCMNEKADTEYRFDRYLSVLRVTLKN